MAPPLPRKSVLAYSTIELEVRNEEHRGALVRLWSENLPHHERVGQVARARLQWLYDDNPAGPPRTLLALHVEQTSDHRLRLHPPPPDVGARPDDRDRDALRLRGDEEAPGGRRARSGSSARWSTAAAPPAWRSCAAPRTRSRCRSSSASVTTSSATRTHGSSRCGRPTSCAPISRTRCLARLAGPVVDLALRSIDLARVPPRRAWAGAIVDRADERFDALWSCARALQDHGREDVRVPELALRRLHDRALSDRSPSRPRTAARWRASWSSTRARRQGVRRRSVRGGSAGRRSTSS